MSRLPDKKLYTIASVQGAAKIYTNCAQKYHQTHNIKPLADKVQCPPK
jgi:hypothetical protein